MQCPQCQFENREEAKFCKKCGNKLERLCPSCSHPYQVDSLFCDECGCDIGSAKEISSAISETESPPLQPAVDIDPNDLAPIDGERKHVTVLFSDLTGYTAMSEKLDPEEVKDITTEIFDKISKIVNKYEGFIEKYAGDAVMALFGATTAHEDDPVRAIQAAREIHSFVDSISPRYEKKVQHPLSMHTGINTGLVVTGEVNLEKGTHGVAGDTINVASRLSALGAAGDILTAADTFYQTDGYFDFKELQPATMKGKKEPVRIFKVLSQKDQPIKIRRLHGMKADLIGRKVEMNQLVGAVEKLREGNVVVFSICGTVGTGKSRLIQEFKESLNQDEIQWLEGQAFPFSQNMPYFPLINLLSRAFQIKDGDATDVIKDKIEVAISSLIEEKRDVVPYIGTLFSLSYPGVEEVSPEFWQSQLQKAIKTLLTALAGRAPLVICLEDLHWSDPSFLELIRLIFSEFQEPVLFLCSYRPVISLFTSHQINNMANSYREIHLQDLSPTESQSMVESLLKIDTIPSDLQQVVQNKAEGNPFYLEELINSLIESETLKRENGKWSVTRPISESDISSTIHGVISGRLDRLEKEKKRILQEASVIGRIFLYEILKRVSELKEDIDQYLRGLEQLDFIRTRSLQPELEYLFKHALTQEVVYGGLLKKERRKIHERIGQVMEQLFENRLSEFYETLAIHFRHGRSVTKAVYYLMKSGEKNLKRYAVEESHQYYKDAFELLSAKSDKSDKENIILIDLLIQWAWVFHYRADYKGLTELLSSHKELAEAIGEKAKLGMFYAMLGLALFYISKLKDSYQYLGKALNIGEETEDQQVTNYACAMLAGTCADLGLLDEAIAHGIRAQEISMHPDIYVSSLACLGRAYAFSGEWKKALETGKTLLSYGQQHSNSRGMATGHWLIGYSYFIRGEFATAIECGKEGLQVSIDPINTQMIRVALGVWCAMDNRLKEAEENLKKVKAFTQKFDAIQIETTANLFLGAVMIAQGNMSQGFKMIEDANRTFLENHSRTFYASSEWILGKVYLQIVEKSQTVKPITILKNIGFIIKNVPFAAQKAETHFNKAIELTTKMGAKGFLGMAYFDLGLLHKANKRTEKARGCILEAIKIFEKLAMERILRKAEEALASLE